MLWLYGYRLEKSTGGGDVNMEKICTRFNNHCLQIGDKITLKNEPSDALFTIIRLQQISELGTVVTIKDEKGNYYTIPEDVISSIK